MTAAMERQNQVVQERKKNTKPKLGETHTKKHLRDIARSTVARTGELFKRANSPSFAPVKTRSADPPPRQRETFRAWFAAEHGTEVPTTEKPRKQPKPPAPLPTMEQLKKANRTRKRKAQSHDGTSNFLLSLGPDRWWDTYLQAIHNSWTTGYIPEWVEHSNVWPLYKAGNPNLGESWRPISLIHAIHRIVPSPG